MSHDDRTKEAGVGTGGNGGPGQDESHSSHATPRVPGKLDSPVKSGEGCGTSSPGKPSPAK